MPPVRKQNKFRIEVNTNDFTDISVRVEGSMGGQGGPVKYVGLGFLIISIVGFIAALVALGSSLAIVLPELYESVVTLFSSISPRIVSSAYAAEGNVIFPASTDSQVTYKLIINVGIMVMIAIGFFWSLWVTYHSADPKRVQTASDFVKMLFGFLLGSAKSFLGAP